MTLMIFDHLAVGPLQCNCYIVGDDATKDAVVLDPGDDAEGIADRVAALSLRVKAIVATHAHFDHIVAAQRLRELLGAPFILHREDEPLLSWMQVSGRMFLGVDLPAPPEVDTFASEGDLVKMGEHTLEVVHTPGHSPGSISLVSDDALFSGDTLFAGSIGRTDLPGGDTQQLLDSVRFKLFELPDELPVYPGHGAATTVAQEKATNPFVGERSRLWTPPE